MIIDDNDFTNPVITIRRTSAQLRAINWVSKRSLLGRKVVITGLVTHGCAKATSLGAMEKGYQVVLVCDGHSNYSAGAAAIIEKWNTTINKK